MFLNSFTVYLNNWVSIPALSKESSGILLLPLSVRPPNSVSILSHSQIIFKDLIGHVLQMRNKVLELTPRGQERVKNYVFS